MVSSRDERDPRRDGQAQERARRRTSRAPHKQATSTAVAARGSLGAAEKAAACLATGACGSSCGASPLSDSLRPARRAPSTPAPCSVVLRGLTPHSFASAADHSGDRPPGAGRERSCEEVLREEAGEYRERGWEVTPCEGTKPIAAIATMSRVWTAYAGRPYLRRRRQPAVLSASTWALAIRASMKGSNPPDRTCESWWTVSPMRWSVTRFCGKL